MSLRMKGIWILAGLAVMAAMSAGGVVAQAGSVGVIGHITPLPGGSPFLYEFELELDSGTIAPGTTLTVGTPPHGIIGVNMLSGTQQPPTTGAAPLTTGSFQAEASSLAAQGLTAHNPVLRGSI